ncbi:hypothetical protein [Streptomyces wuyuanensis]|uniref:hypothetical protein n=1 Tax=Streptomyces wuyuanensis TaxID=1196353 RepID=UPI00341C03BA
MSEADPAELRRCLDEIHRQTAGLPDDRRRQVLSELAEHIRAALEGGADRSGASEPGPGPDGPPAAGARTDGGRAPGKWREGPERRPVAARGPARPGPVSRESGTALGAVLLLGLSFPLTLALLPAAVGPVVGMFLRAAGLVLLWFSPAWTVRRKTAGTVVTALLPIALVQAWLRLLPPQAHTTALQVLVNVAITLLPLAGALWLWHARRRPRPPGMTRSAGPAR